MSLSNERGIELEQRILDALKHLKAEYPKSFRYEYQPKITTHLEYEYIPDFSVEVVLPPFRLGFFVECQRRNRVGRDINEKIDAMRLRSEFNLFFFVYDGILPEARKQYMQGSGTTCLPVADFLELLGRLSETLHIIRVASLPATGLLRLGFFGK